MSKTLTIRYTSDTHGYLYPTSYADMQDRPMGLMKRQANIRMTATRSSSTAATPFRGLR